MRVAPKLGGPFGFTLVSFERLTRPKTKSPLNREHKWREQLEVERPMRLT